MSSIHVTVPIVFWGHHPPVHDITCMTRTEEDKGVATGTKTGQICIWDLYRKRINGEFVLCPRLLLLGMQSSILSLAFVKNWSGDRDRIVSLSKNGCIALWDGKDGTCLKTVNNLGNGMHYGIKSIARPAIKETLIAVWGQYHNIFILDPNTLEFICALKSSHNPNWISQLCFIPNIDKNDAMIAITVDGTLKVWLIHTNIEMKEMTDLFEERSKALGLTNPLSLSSESIADFSLALVVCKDSWQIYDASDGRMKQLLIHPCEPGVTEWINGSFLSYNMVLLWALNGMGYLYELAPHILPGMIDDRDDASMSTSGSILLATLSPTDSAPSAPPSSFPLSPLSYATLLTHRWGIIGDQYGRLQVWHVESIIRKLHVGSEEGSSAPDFKCHFTGSLSDSWQSPATPCSLIDSVYPSNMAGPSSNITVSLFLTQFGRLICGLSNGDIIVLSATQAATKLLLAKRKFSRAWPQHYFLRGHKRRVTSLLYPCDYSSAYDNNHLLSGGADFSVRLWDLYKGILLHTFAVHGGVVSSIVTCPPDINTRLQTCVCSIADDHSVAILSTSQNKCLLLASCHTSTVLSVHWRLEEDFLLINCVGGGLYVWQIETGTLDRYIEGETAKIILDNTISSNKLMNSSQTSPIQVRSLSLGHEYSLIQILLFDPQYLINKLQKMEKVVSKPRPVSDVAPHARAFRRYISARKNFNVSETSPSVQRKTGQPDASPREQAKALEKIGDAVAGVKSEVIKPEPPDTTINTARLLVSCLHAWNLDNTLDKECEDTLGLVRPSCPVSFGLLSKGGALSLVLPGWGLVREKPSPVHNNAGVTVDDLLILNQLSETQSAINATLSVQKERSLTVPVSLEEEEEKREEEKDINEEGIQSELLNHVRWQLSRSLTTQHLLTVVSITNTLMNQTCGAHMLATGSGVSRRLASESTESEGSSDEDDHTLRDNLIRGTWSKVAALHCVMLPERMADYFRPPHLPVLASRFMDPTQAIREAAQALLQSELRRVGVRGRLQLVSHWSSKLHSPSSFKTTHDHRSKSHDEADYYDGGVTQATPTQQQQMTALVILGMIGAEFNVETKRTPSLQKQTRKTSRKKVESMPPGANGSDDFEVLDPQVARQTAKTLEAVLLDRPLQKSSLYSPLRCSAAELMGRGFHLWEKYVNVPSVVMGLLDLSVLPHLTVIAPTGPPPDEKTNKKTRAAKFLAETAKRALNLMVLLRPTTVVTAIAKELSLFLGSQHGTPFPHPSLPPLQVGQTPPPNTNGIVNQASVLLPAAKEEMIDLVKTILDKCSGHVSSQILDIADIALYCLDQDELKRKNFNDLFPSLTKLPNVSYSLRTKRLAVGAGSGQIGIYDLKQRKTQMINAHSHQVIVLSFSEEGKYLATYSYGDSMLKVWQINTSILSGVINSAPKCIHNWPAISNTTTATNYNYVRIEWTSNKSVVLHMPGGIEYKYSL